MSEGFDWERHKAWIAYHHKYGRGSTRFEFDHYPDLCPTFVYFIHDDSDGLVKIGFARDVYKRLRQLSRAKHSKLRLLGCFRGTRSDELRMHKFFEKERAHGEWFVLSERIARAILVSKVPGTTAQDIECGALGAR